MSSALAYLDMGEGYDQLDKRYDKFLEANAYLEMALEAQLKHPDGKPMVIRSEEDLHINIGPPDKFNCPDDCTECIKHFRRLFQQNIDCQVYTNSLKDKEAEVIAKDFTENIFRMLSNIRGKLESHGNVIFKIWNKKTREERKSLVLQVAPDMFKAKAPQAYLSNKKNGWQLQRRYRTTYLLPYLTVDNVCDDKLKLFGLLHARSAYEPEDWVMFDSEQLNTGFTRGSLALTYNRHTVVLHGPDYGKLVKWNREDAHRWNTVGWPRAQLILEAQSTLMQFLNGIVQKMLEGRDGSTGCDKWNKVITTGFKAPGGQEFWSSYNNQAFLAPPDFEPSALLEIAKTRLAVGEDEMELLQTDPSYILMQAKKLLKLGYVSNLGKAGDTEKWATVAFELVNGSKGRARDWRFITQELTYVCELHAKYNTSSIEVGHELPKEYELLLGSLQELIMNIYSRKVSYLHNHLVMLSGFQDHYEAANGDGSYRLKHTSSDLDALFKEDPLFWAMARLSGYGPDYVEVNQAFYLNFIDDHLAASTPQEKARIDQRTYDYLADLGCLDLIMSRLKQMRPFAMPIGRKAAVETQAERGGELGAWRNLLVPVKDASQKSCKLLADSLKAFVEHGWPKGQKDQRWLQQANRSRELLSGLWTAYEQVFNEGVGSSNKTQEEIECERSLLRFAYNPSHLARVKAERAAILAPQHRPLPAETARSVGFETSLSSQLPEVSLKPEIIRSAKLQLAKPKKGKNQSSQPIQHVKANKDMLPSVTGGSKLVSSIEVGPATLRVFKSTFRADGDAASKVRWPQFSAAMVDTGCSAIQNSGSEVTFKHDTYGSIVLHRPHPHPTIEPDILRTWGKRLTKRFGWCKEVFVERKMGVA